ncbi:hypothetical protein GOP47_0010090 [Adiantum capillus-veneris]|uniref:Acireductone dioxygenase n=1 Tax=Adiantum capillus-veneris TaxID=13818 RepID=A0A9D4UUM1_ADICA|nr:hypothetical protein GOP47_0010090 [Adiantum capillus-veneris]
MEAWEFNPAEEDRRLPHKYIPNRPVPLEHLEELGVLRWVIDADNWETDAILNRVKAEQGYVFWEILTVAPGLMEEFEKKSQHFFEEHLHPYEESRLILKGSGYWDIRDYNNKWIRFKVSKGDMITLPPGMYHRFTVDTNDYIKAVLLYKETPRRVDLVSPHGDETQARQEYMVNVLNNKSATFRSDLASTTDL